MKLGDRALGLLAAILGAAVVLHARTFPPMPGQPIGPSFFPIVIGCGVIVLGAVLFAGARRRRSGPFVELDAWVRRPRMLVNFALVIASLLFYALAVDSLGFLVTGVLLLSALFFAFGVLRARILPLALAVTLVVHYVFYSLLRVPLPWGVLEGIAW